MNLNKLINFSFSLALVIFLIPVLTTNAYGQKGLDGGKNSSETSKPEPKKPVGKGLDDGGNKNNSSNKAKPVGKDLDDGGKNSKPELVEIKPKTETTIFVNSVSTAERTNPSPRKEPPRRTEKVEPLKPIQDEIDVATQYPEMAVIPSGSFMMGSMDGQENESPTHEVVLSSFEISKHEITNNQFRTFIKASGYKTSAEEDGSAQTWKSYAIAGRANYPVVYITYKDALAYCNWLSEKTKQTYRLPTEAEWEYAARGGTKEQAYPWGKEIEASKANYAYDDTRKAYGEPILEYLKPVGSYIANGFGLYDVIGNVAEWCLDGFKADFYKESPKQDPICPDQGSSRIVRGGGWMNSNSFCSVSFRKTHPGAYKSSSLGFRIVRVTKSNDNSPVANNQSNAHQTSSNASQSNNTQTSNSPVVQQSNKSNNK